MSYPLSPSPTYHYSCGLSPTGSLQSLRSHDRIPLTRRLSRIQENEQSKYEKHRDQLWKELRLYSMGLMVLLLLGWGWHSYSWRYSSATATQITAAQHYWQDHPATSEQKQWPPVHPTTTTTTTMEEEAARTLPSSSSSLRANHPPREEILDQAIRELAQYQQDAKHRQELQHETYQEVIKAQLEEHVQQHQQQQREG